MRSFAALILLTIALCACSRRTPESTYTRHYPLSGTIVALNAKDRTATIDAAAIPNFMEAMTMQYPLARSVDMNALHTGEKINATMNVSSSGDEYNVSDIQPQNAAPHK